MTTKEATKIDAFMVGHLRGGQVGGIADAGAVLRWQGEHQRLLSYGMGSRTEADPDELHQCRHRRCRDLGVLGWRSTDALRTHEIKEQRRVEELAAAAETAEREAKSNREMAEALHEAAETASRSSSGFAQIQHERDSQKHFRRSDTATEEAARLREEIEYRQQEIDD